MELDPRIKSIDSIRSFNTNNSDCSGKVGYFTNYVDNFDNLDDVCKGTCVFEEGGSFPFYAIKTDSLENRKFQFFIPENELLPKKEKQYRPFTIDEFLNHFDIGEVIVFRSKNMTNCVCHTLFNGYVEKENKCVFIILGLHSYTLSELFSSYEYGDGDSDNWFPFGVEE